MAPVSRPSTSRSWCAAAVAAVALSAAGCSGGSTGAVPSTTPDVSPTASATVTPLPPEEQPSDLPSAVPSTPVPSIPVTKAAVDGDVDGDGEVDAVRATADLLSVALSKSGRTVTAPVHADSPAAPQVMGSTDVDRDGYAEVFVQTVQGASTTFLTPYRFDGTRLHEMQLDGSPALLGIGGSHEHGDGFRCTPEGRLELRSATANQDGSTYAVKVTTYRLSATDLVQLSTSTVQAPEGDKRVTESYVVDCGSVGEGG